MINLALIGVLGLFVFLLPHLGFPHTWQANMYTVFGLAIIALAYRESLTHAESSSDDMSGESERAYVDSEPHTEKSSGKINGSSDNAEGF